MPSCRSSRFSLFVAVLLVGLLGVGPSAAAQGAATNHGRGLILATDSPTYPSRPMGQGATDLAASRLRWPTTGRITQNYGCTGFSANLRVGSCRHFHTGIDIANAKWTPIRAAASGTVRFVGREPWGAWMVVIGHGSGLRTAYAHMVPRRVPGVARGRTVRQGQVIGYMSNSGLATGVHLHFEVRRDGRAVNPRNYLPVRRP